MPFRVVARRRRVTQTVYPRERERGEGSVLVNRSRRRRRCCWLVALWQTLESVLPAIQSLCQDKVRAANQWIGLSGSRQAIQILNLAPVNRLFREGWWVWPSRKLIFGPSRIDENL